MQELLCFIYKEAPAQNRTENCALQEHCYSRLTTRAGDASRET